MTPEDSPQLLVHRATVELSCDVAVDELIDRLADELAAGGARDVTVEAVRDDAVIVELVGEGQDRAQAGADAAQRVIDAWHAVVATPGAATWVSSSFWALDAQAAAAAQPVERGVREARFAREDDQRITPIVHVPGAMAA